MSDDWHYQQGNAARGPRSAEEMQALIQAGHVTGDTLVWREGFETWRSLSETELAGERLQVAPPPLPPPLPPPAPTQYAQRATSPTPRSTSQDTNWLLVAAPIAILMFVGGVIWLAISALSTTEPKGNLVAESKQKTRGEPIVKTSKKLPEPAQQTNPLLVVEDARQANPATNEQPPIDPLAPYEDTAVADPKPPESAVPPPALPTKPDAPIIESQQPSSPSSAQTTTLYQRIDVERAPRMSILGAVTQQQLKYAIVSRLDIKPPDDEGKFIVDQTISETQLFLADDLSKAMFVDSLAKLKGWQFTFRFNAAREVIEFSSKPPDGKKAEAVKVKGGEGFLVTSVIDDDGWKELAQLTFFAPPEQMKPSKSWSRQMTHNFEPLGGWYGQTTFKPYGREKNQSRFVFTHELMFQPPDKPSEGLPFTIEKASLVPQQAGGNIVYDDQAKRIVAAEEQFIVRGEIQASIAGTAVPLEIGETQHLMVRLADEPFKLDQ